MDGASIAILVAIVVTVILLGVLSHRNKVLRRKRLIEKYGLEIAEDIIAKRIWQGMTVEQLMDSWGRPVDIDTKVYKTKTRETWKYKQTGKNRFRERVYTENGIVVGWQQR